MPRHWLPAASFQPPSLPIPDAATSRRSGRPDWVLLDRRAYITVTDDRRNGTTAEASTSDGQAVKVSFWLADPPSVSHFCVHCPGLKESDFAEEPLVVCSEKNIAILFISFTFGPSYDPHGPGIREYFVYRAHPEHPSLHPLPSSRPRFFNPHEVGILPCVHGDGDDFILAALCGRLTPREYDLHIYFSKEERWSSKLTLLEPISPNSRNTLLPHLTHKVITLEGGSLGWVDLWRGVLLCNVFDKNPVARYIPLPWPAISLKESCPDRCPLAFRDVICSKGLIKFIEVEPYERPCVREAMASHDTSILFDEDLVGNVDTSIVAQAHACYGWRAAIWNRELHSRYWRRVSMAHVDEVLVNNPRHSDVLPDMKNLLTSAPILSMYGDDVVYLMSKVNSKDLKAWVICVDIKTKTLQEVASFSADRAIFSNPTYRPCSLSQYLDMTSDNCNAGCKMEEERKDYKNVPNDTTIVLHGLDPCITEDNLRQVFNLFGEVQYVKILAHKHYGIVEYIDRSCAENAILSLNGALIGAQIVHLSWGCSLEQPPQQNISRWNGTAYCQYAQRYGGQRDSSPTTHTYQGYGSYPHQQPAQKNASQCNGAIYHDYGWGYGGQEYSSPTIQNPNVYAYGTYPGYVNYQHQHKPTFQHQPTLQH